MKKKCLSSIGIQGLVFVLAVFLFPGVAISGNVSWWTKVFPLDTVERTMIMGLSQDLATYIDISASGSFHEKVDVVRDFIHSNSVHKIDDEFYSYWYDIPALMTMLAAHAESSEA